MSQSPIVYQVTTLHNLTRPIIRPISDEIYNLDGQKLHSFTLPWLPHIFVGQCDSQGKKCLKQYGLIADVLDVLGARFNFTWSTDLEVSDAGWGKNKNLIESWKIIIEEDR